MKSYVIVAGIAVSILLEINNANIIDEVVGKLKNIKSNIKKVMSQVNNKTTSMPIQPNEKISKPNLDGTSKVTAINKKLGDLRKKISKLSSLANFTQSSRRQGKPSNILQNLMSAIVDKVSDIRRRLSKYAVNISDNDAGIRKSTVDSKKSFFRKVYDRLKLKITTMVDNKKPQTDNVINEDKKVTEIMNKKERIRMLKANLQALYLNKMKKFQLTNDNKNKSNNIEYDDGKFHRANIGDSNFINKMFLNNIKQNSSDIYQENKKNGKVPDIDSDSMSSLRSRKNSNNKDSISVLHQAYNNRSNENVLNGSSIENILTENSNLIQNNYKKSADKLNELIKAVKITADDETKKEINKMVFHPF